MSALQLLRSRGRLRGVLALLDPALVAGVAYIYPGKFAANFTAGARFGYTPAWVIVVANLMAILVQYLSAKAGVVTGRDLPDLCRQHLPRPISRACDQVTGVVLTSTDVYGKTNEITRFQPLLDQIGDLRDAVVTADALHCQREHVTYLAERGGHWVLTVKGNQPSLHAQLAGLPWRAVPDAIR
ncbi:divalent metal cation transporter [Micromonospora sp. LZ34]